MSRSVLIVTLPPDRGGVPDKARILANFLRESGNDVTVAHYATLSGNRDLVVPSWTMIGRNSPGVSQTSCFTDFPCIAVGCYLPELEFTYYIPTTRWRDLLARFDRHVVVSGTVLTGYTLAILGLPHMVWCASTMIDDRIDRRRAMSFPRGLFDRTIPGPVQRKMERRVLSGPGNFMTVSSYARNTLIEVGMDPERSSVVPVPVDQEVFCPPASPPETGRIGFAGRAEDPRKNLPLLLRAIRILRDRGEGVALSVTGDPSGSLRKIVMDLGVNEYVKWTGWLTDCELPEFYKSLDVFVFPSGKEGLGIAGIQAMASGVPVVSTRCGGPEDYVIPDRTGVLVDTDENEMANAISAIVSSRDRRHRMGEEARSLMMDRYAVARFQKDVANIWRHTWGDDLHHAPN